MPRGGLIGRIDRVLPPQLRLSTGDVTAAVMWGGTAAVGAVWLVQPFGYIKTLIGGKEPAEAAEEPAPVTEKKQDKPPEEPAPAPAPDTKEKQEGDE